VLRGQGQCMSQCSRESNKETHSLATKFPSIECVPKSIPSIHNSSLKIWCVCSALFTKSLLHWMDQLIEK
jgi:hypothetical protein